MIDRWRLKVNNGWVGLVSVFGLGLLPCPDCGVPLAVHIWPAAAVIWLYRRVRQRHLHKLDLLLAADLISPASPFPEGAESLQDDLAKEQQFGHIDLNQVDSTHASSLSNEGEVPINSRHA
jgi:hypothetical protein